MPVPRKTQKHPAMPGVFTLFEIWLVGRIRGFYTGRFCGLAAGAYGMAGAIVVIAHPIAAILASAVTCTLVLRKRRFFNYRHVENFHSSIIADELFSGGRSPSLSPSSPQLRTRGLLSQDRSL
jgi:hypothetical protein